MQKLAKIINEFGCAILDGALATELETSGIQLHKTLWSAYCLVDNPQAIQSVHYNVL
jgi:homocysteine S-methyltransferase